MTMRDEPIHPPSEDLFAYRDGELLPEKRALMEAHVMGCSVCRSFIDQVSSLESEVRRSPDRAPDGYLEKLHESVRARITAEGAPKIVPAEKPRIEEVTAGVGARRTPADWSGRERRGNGAAGTDEDARGNAPRLPWAAVLSTASAAAAVLVVVVILLKQGIGQRVMPAREPVAMRTPAETEGDRAEVGSVEEKDSAAKRQKVTDQSATDATGAAPGSKVDPAAPSLNRVETESSDSRARLEALADRKLDENTASQEKKAAELGKVQEGQGRDQERLDGARAAREEPKASAVAPAPAPYSFTPSTEYEALMDRFGLPPVWHSADVIPEAILRVEPELRSLYVSGGAGRDSARIRLYLAEATRLRYAPGDSTLYREIQHHYRRAISLSGPDEETARVAEERLQTLEQ